MDSTNNQWIREHDLAKYNELVRLIQNDIFRHELDLALSNPFEVMVIGTMKAGKSTLLNALLGQDLLPTNTTASTSIPYRLEDCDEMDTFKCRAVIGEEIRDWEDATSDILTQWNNSPICSLMELEGNLPFIKNEGARLVLYDTPGPNNAIDERHGTITKKVIENKNYGLILYMLATNQLCSDDEAKLLKLVKSALSKDHNGKKKRIIFVMNHADEFDEEKPDQAIRSVVKKQKKWLEEMGFIKPVIVPIIARDALYIRMAILQKPLPREAIEEFSFLIKRLERRKIPLIYSATCSRSVKSHIRKGLQGGACLPMRPETSLDSKVMVKNEKYHKSRLLRALFSTGVPTLEACLAEMIITQALPETRSKVCSILQKYNAKHLEKWMK